MNCIFIFFSPTVLHWSTAPAKELDVILPPHSVYVLVSCGVGVSSTSQYAGKLRMHDTARNSDPVKLELLRTGQGFAAITTTRQQRWEWPAYG